MQRREQAGAAGAENQNVGLEPFEGHNGILPHFELYSRLQPDPI
jgi:hypothetical protein